MITKLQIIILILLSNYVCLAQTNVTNIGDLYIKSSTDIVYITGSLVNGATATLNNVSGNIHILQNLINDEPNMAAGGGNLYFTGSVLQTVSGTQPYRTHNWIVNNTSNVVLANRVGVGNGTTGNLTFANGNITTGTSTQDVLLYENSTYSGYTDSKHIIGYCTKRGNTDFTFPIGDGTYKTDLDIANLSSSTDFQCKYFGVGYGNYTYFGELISIYDKEYWTLNRTLGTADAQITLKWNDARNPLNHIDPHNLRVAHFDGTVWNSEGGMGGTNTSTGVVTSMPVTNYSPFTFGSTSSILPLMIHHYQVLASANCNVSIAWQNALESEVAYYTVQKSNNNTNWQTIATDATTTNGKHTYTDNTQLNDNWLYRVQIVEKNGAVHYTDCKMVKLSCNENKINVYPTIATHIVNLKLTNTTINATVKVYNQSGQAMPVAIQRNGTTIVLNVENYKAGNYTITITTANDTQSFKIIKMN